MKAFDSLGLLDNGEYLVITIKDMEFSVENAFAILGGKSSQYKNKLNDFLRKIFEKNTMGNIYSLKTWKCPF